MKATLHLLLCEGWSDISRSYKMCCFFTWNA